MSKGQSFLTLFSTFQNYKLTGTLCAILVLGRLTRLVQHVIQEQLSLQEHLSSPPLFTCLSGTRVVHVVKLHVFTFSIPCCDVRYDFHVKALFDSSPICFISVICIYLLILVSNTISISDNVRVV